MNNRVVRTLALALVLVALLPGCTFYSLEGGFRPRSSAELADISPVIYIVLAVFVLILIVSVGTALADGPRYNDVRERDVPVLIAGVAILVVLLLVG